MHLETGENWRIFAHYRNLGPWNRNSFNKIIVIITLKWSVTRQLSTNVLTDFLDTFLLNSGHCLLRVFIQMCHVLNFRRIVLKFRTLSGVFRRLQDTFSWILLNSPEFSWEFLLNSGSLGEMRVATACLFYNFSPGAFCKGGGISRNRKRYSFEN